MHNRIHVNYILQEADCTSETNMGLMFELLIPVSSFVLP